MLLVYSGKNNCSMCFSANGGKILLYYAVKNVFPEVKWMKMSLQVTTSCQKLEWNMMKYIKKIVRI